MSPNSNHHLDSLDSYQHCSEHEALYIGEDIYSDGGAIEAGGGVDHHHGQKQKGKRADADTNITAMESSSTFFEHVRPRNKRQAVIALIGILLAFGFGWFASDAFHSTRHYNNHSHKEVDDDGVSTDQQPSNSDEHNNMINSDSDSDAITTRRFIPDLIWSDEFDGDSVDLTKWTFVNGNGCDVGLCGWGNNELQWYTPSNTHVSDGRLVIEARKFETAPGSGSSSSPANNYTSSKIISKGKADFGVVAASSHEDNNGDDDINTLAKSRRFESRMKLPWGNGIWPAFWMLPTYETFGGWPQSGEIDIMESVGKEGNTVHGTVHYGLEWPQHQYSESGITTPTTTTTLSKSVTISSSPLDDASNYLLGNLNETYHTYAVERLPGIIRWYIDDIEYKSITKEDMNPYHWSFDEEFYFIFNFAVGGNWPGYPLEEDGPDGHATVFPQVLEVDYVRVYEGIFPRIIGKSEVECSEKNVVYEVANVVEAIDISYSWVVPQNAIIMEGQGTSRIIVNFDSAMMESNMVENEVIHVQASGIEASRISTSTGLAKLQEHGIGIRVKIVDFNGKCSYNNEMNDNSTGLKQVFDFDCGRPDTCTPSVLHRTTDEFTCGERIQWLINEMGMGEKAACREVGYEQFHGHCGPCNPLA